MTHHRYPIAQMVTQQDVTASGWRDVLTNSAEVGWSHMWHDFSGAARDADQDGRLAHARVLWLLADACSMRLIPSSANDPFRPDFVLEGKRSAVPSDFSADDLAIVEMAATEIGEPWMKSRLADLLWLVGRPRKVQNALEAIDAYRLIPLEANAWLAGGSDGWARAIGLARMLRGAAGDRLDKMERSIIDRILVAGADSRYLGLWMSELLHDNGLGEESRDAVAEKLLGLAVSFRDAGEIHVSRDYFAAAGTWFALGKNNAQSMAMLVEEAESWVREAAARVAGSAPSYLVASSNYESAIQVYRRIPREHRGAHGVDERLTKLHTMQSDAGARSVSEMRRISTPNVDITPLIERARASVHGKALTEALLAFSSLYQGPKWTEVLASAEAKIRRHPLSSMFSSMVMSRDGRVIAKRPGINIGGGNREEEVQVVRAEAIRDFSLTVGLVVHGQILPALEVVLVENRASERDFVQLAYRSPLVPPGRERLFGKALFRGFEGDWASAIHLLSPQIENMARFHLKEAGVKTTTLDPRGIETENGLSALMEMDEAKTIFGEDLVFEIRAIFCDPFGPNLRNEISHGLLEDDQFSSPYLVYAWWLALRLIFNAWWNSSTEEAEARVAESGNG